MIYVFPNSMLPKHLRANTADDVTFRELRQLQAFVAIVRTPPTDAETWARFDLQASLQYYEEVEASSDDEMTSHACKMIDQIKAALNDPSHSLWLVLFQSWAIAYDEALRILSLGPLASRKDEIVTSGDDKIIPPASGRYPSGHYGHDSTLYVPADSRDLMPGIATDSVPVLLQRLSPPGHRGDPAETQVRETPLTPPEDRDDE